MSERERGEDDFALLDAWRAGDEQAGQELFRRHVATLYRFYHNKTSRDVDDLVQDALLACLKSQKGFEKRSTFKAYLLAVARYQLYDYYRRWARDGALLDFGSITLYDVDPTPSAVAAGQAEEQLLLNALRRLPVNLQIALELTYWEDMKAPELADVLDVPVDTVYSRLRRARELLKEELAKLATSSKQLESTQTNLGGWARAVRDRLSRP